jgi:hypothetical protein
VFPDARHQHRDGVGGVEVSQPEDHAVRSEIEQMQLHRSAGGLLRLDPPRDDAGGEPLVRRRLRVVEGGGEQQPVGPVASPGGQSVPPPQGGGVGPQRGELCRERERRPPCRHRGG